MLFSTIVILQSAKNVGIIILVEAVQIHEINMISQQIIEDWVKNKRRIQDRLNRIKKRIKKLSKQEKHFEMRLRTIKQYENSNREKPAGTSSGDRGQDCSTEVQVP